MRPPGAAPAAWGTVAFRAVPMVTAFPLRCQTELDATGVAFAMAPGLVSSLAFGLAPARQRPRVNPAGAPGRRADGQPSTLRHALMGIQATLATIVRIAAALFVESFAEPRDVDPGFTREGAWLGAYDFTGTTPDAAAARGVATPSLKLD